MADPVNERRNPSTPGAQPDSPGDDTAYVLDSDLEERIVDALEAENIGQIEDLVAPLHYADVADLLERLSRENRRGLIDILRDGFDPEILPELDDTVRDEILDKLGLEDVAPALAELDTDDAVEIIEELDEDEQQQVLDAIPAGERYLIEQGLSFPEDSAGRLMQRDVVTAPEFWTVGQVIDFIRKSAAGDDDDLPAVFYNVFVVDPTHAPVGAIPVSRLLLMNRKTLVTEAMETEVQLIPATQDQEEVAFLFRQRDLVSAAVVDDGGRLVGVITIDDVVDVIHEEHEEDIMRLGGVPEDDLYEAAAATTRSRFTWLLLSLGTAFIASSVIGIFKATIEQMVALAILLPIVASLGGNAGTQSLTVAVRALATKELTETNAMRVIGKELLVGCFNGTLFAVLTGAVAWAWFGDPHLGMVIGMAMFVTLIVAGLSGVTIPVILDRLGIDPAIASSIFLITITDVIGFFVFLGLATWLLV
jgi:magnesium transporter